MSDLEQSKEHESDALLIQYIRIQHLMEKIAQLISPNETNKEMAGIPRAPMSAYASAFQGELDKIRDNLPENLRNNCDISRTSVF